MGDGYERARLVDALGDFVVYRDLEPADGRLAGLRRIWSELGMDSYHVPRKAEPDYAATVLHFVRQARALRDQPTSPGHLIYIGDTRLLDGTAFRHLRATSGWTGWAFICSEDTTAEARVVIEDDVYLANRWAQLGSFLGFVQEQGFVLDRETVAVIDLDKTTLGARGRNDGAVDAARVEGVSRTMGDTLGSAFDAAAFRAIYDELNQPRAHAFTGDNQDILAYVCLMVVDGVYDVGRLRSELAAPSPLTFEDLLQACHEALAGSGHGSAATRAVHAEVRGNHLQGDPTPFKSFRRREYLATLARMDFLGDDAPLDRVLREEITLTREVLEAIRWLRARDVLCFGISDKPDEASTPTALMVEDGYEPLHRARMKVTGKHLFTSRT